MLTVGKPLSTCQTSDRRYIYSLRVRYIPAIYVYVIFMVYSDDIRLRYIYGFYFSSKKLSYIPKKYLKYNVRKGMVGRSEDVPGTFECLVGLEHSIEYQKRNKRNIRHLEKMLLWYFTWTHGNRRTFNWPNPSAVVALIHTYGIAIVVTEKQRNISFVAPQHTCLWLIYDFLFIQSHVEEIQLIDYYFL